MKLSDMRMHDGSRLFMSFPDSLNCYWLRDGLAAAPGVLLTDFMTNDVSEVWIDFKYGGHHFTVNNPSGEYWVFVKDPTAPEPLLQEVALLLKTLLER